MGFSTWAYSLYQQAMRANWWHFCFSSFFFIGVAIVIFFVTKLILFFKSRKHQRARLIMPVTSGPRGIEMLRKLVDLAKYTACDLGYFFIIGNFDVRNSLLPAFTKNREKYKTIFLQKWISNDNTDDSHGINLFHPDNLF